MGSDSWIPYTLRAQIEPITTEFAQCAAFFRTHADFKDIKARIEAELSVVRAGIRLPEDYGMCQVIQRTPFQREPERGGGDPGNGDRRPPKRCLWCHATGHLLAKCRLATGLCEKHKIDMKQSASAIKKSLEQAGCVAPEPPATPAR